MKINTKMMVFILTTTLVIYAIAMGYISISAKKTTFSDATKLVNTYAIDYALQIEETLSEDMAKMRTLAQSFNNYKTIPDSLRMNIIRNMYKGVFANNPHFYGLWDSWELSVIDSTWKLPYGRNVEELWRDKGIIHNQNTLKSENGDPPDYARIKKNAVEVIEEPYFYSYTGLKKDEKLMTSLIAPILDNGTYVGVVGVDIVLEVFQKLINEITPFENSKAYLISNKGVFVGHPDIKWVGKNFGDQYGVISEDYNVINSIQSNKKFHFIYKNSFDGLKYYISFVPINVGKVKSPWSLAITTPVNVITAIADRNFRISLIIGIIGLLILSIIIFLIARNISKPLNKTTVILEKLSTGDIDNISSLDIDNNDEIGDMAQSVNTLISGLIATSKFANEIGQGNLNAEFKALSEADTLGNSLLKMRKSLIHAEKEEEKRKQEDEIQKWTTEGIAKFGEILRQNNDNIEELTFQLMSNLIDYINANQGAIFVLNDSDEEDIYYELTSAIAYGRKKILKKIIRPGEELVGRCAHEKLTIYLKEVPDNYIDITSGMGTANPREVLIIPVKLADIVYGVIEIASFNEFSSYQIEFVEKIGESIASTISSVKINAKTARLLGQSQKQAEELASQEEEMRQNLEELQATQEESGRREFEMNGLIQALSSSTYTIEYDLNGKITDINDPFLKLIGLYKNQVVGMYHRDGIDFSSQTPQEYEEFWNDLKTGLNKKVVNKIDYHGKMIWLSETYTPIFDKEGKPYKVLKIAFDISDLKEKEVILENQKQDLRINEDELQKKMKELSQVQLELQKKDKEQEKQITELGIENERRLEQFANKVAQSRAILEASPISIIIFDDNGLIEFFNTSAQKTWNYSIADIIGQDIIKVIPGLLNKLNDLIIENEKYNKIVIESESYKVLMADGTKRTMLISVYVSTLTGKPRFTAFASEENDKKNVNIEIKEKEYLETINRLKQQLNAKFKIAKPKSSVKDSIEKSLLTNDDIKKTGLNEIDEQHDKIISLINRFYVAHINNKSKKELKDILRGIIDYTSYHFGTEENYFEIFGYKQTNEHIKYHKEFIIYLKDFQKYFDAGKRQPDTDFFEYIKKWFINHINMQDTQYVSLFKKNGIN